MTRSLGRELSLDIVFAKDALLVQHLYLLQLFDRAGDSAARKLRQPSTWWSRCSLLLLLRLLLYLLVLISVLKVKAVFLHHLRSQVRNKLHVSFFACPHIESVRLSQIGWRAHASEIATIGSH